MRRVRFIHALKSAGTPLIAKFAVFAGLLALAGFFVSFPHVVKNMPSFFEMEQFFRFVLVAFLNTKMAIQAITLGTLILLLLMMRDVVNVFRGTLAWKTV